jgi:hypothetical protein
VTLGFSPCAVALKTCCEKFKMTHYPGTQFVIDHKGSQSCGVRIDLKKHGAIWKDFWDGLISELRRKETAFP